MKGDEWEERGKMDWKGIEDEEGVNIIEEDTETDRQTDIHTC